MKKIKNLLDDGMILLADGAWGTMLQAYGLKPGECPEEWNITHPDEVSGIARRYIEAGSQIVLTNTFGGSAFKLRNYDLQDRVAQINYDGVRLSKQAAFEKAYVFSSVGPTGKFIEPIGDVSEADMYEVFKEQIGAQAKAGADCILIETMSDLKEASIAARAALENTNLPVAVTLTFERGKSGYKTMMGITIEQAVRELERVGVDFLGTNCGNGIHEMIDIVKEMRIYTDKYIIAQPNAGKPRLVDGRTLFEQGPKIMASAVPGLIQAGANIVGGCCGTTPEHIRAIAEILYT